MPEKFIVPQFIDKEDKILGPITVRQFLIILATGFGIFIEYKILAPVYFILTTIVTAAFGGTFGFVKINGQPFHVFFLNFLQTSMRPSLRVWDKTLLDAELRNSTEKGKPAAVMQATTKKPRPSSSRLREMALTVNTGGVYKPED